MNNKPYTIEFLLESFTKHSEAFQKEQKKFIAEYSKGYPLSELPDFLRDDFNISEAMRVMTEEIISLRKSIESLLKI